MQLSLSGTCGKRNCGNPALRVNSRPMRNLLSLPAMVVILLLTNPATTFANDGPMCTPTRVEILQFFDSFDPMPAEAQPKPKESPAIEPIMQQPYDFEEQHSRITKNLQETAVWMDQFFGNDRIAESNASSELRLSWQNNFREYDTPTSKLRLRGKINLPHMQRRLHLVFEGEPDKNDISGLDKQNSTSAIRYNVMENAIKSINFDLGLRGGFSNPRLFTRLWSRKVLLKDHNKLHRLSPALTYDTRLGWETYLRYDTEYEPWEHIFLRTTTRPGWSQDKDGFTFEQNFTAYKQVSDHRFIAVDWLNSAVIYPYSDVLSRLRVRHRRALWMDKLFLEFAPGLRFAEENHYRPEWEAYVTLEIVFSPDRNN